MDEEKEEKTSGKERPPFNIRWVALGVLFIIVVIGIGHGLIERFVLKGDPEVVQALRKMDEAQERIDALKQKGARLVNIAKKRLRTELAATVFAGDVVQKFINS